MDDKSRKIGGKQRITTLDGYVIPLQFKHGLAYLPMSPPTDQDLDEYPHVILTSEGLWDPSILDNDYDLSNLDEELDELPKENVYGDIRFDSTGNYRGVYNSHCRPIKRQDYGEFSSNTPYTDMDLETFVEGCIKSVGLLVPNSMLA